MKPETFARKAASFVPRQGDISILGCIYSYLNIMILKPESLQTIHNVNVGCLEIIKQLFRSLFSSCYSSALAGHVHDAHNEENTHQ